MNTSYEIAHNVNEEVHLVALDIDGFVEEISIGYGGITYKVSYWNNGERYSTWVNKKEIQKNINKNSDSGINRSGTSYSLTKDRRD